MLLGIDRLVRDDFRTLHGLSVGLLSNISCCDSSLKPTISILEKSSKIALKSVFAPEHGFNCALQDQVNVRDSRHRRSVKVHSMYGRNLKPTRQALRKIDAVVIDLPDIGTRYYTFLWSAMLMLQETAQLHKKVFVLDRPNPLSGSVVQGPVIDPGFESFVGLYSVPIRHGMTIGELCSMFNQEHDLGADITIVKMSGWHRRMFTPDAGVAWTVPSPNMPSFSTALVYPGMCLLEGTNVSEGRGTTRPFEIFGAPWIEPYALADALNRNRMPGVAFRPTYFMPTFHKYRGRLCGGIQIHVTNRMRFSPVLAGLQIVRTIRKMFTRQFQWRQPPYEFEKTRMPFDILIGNSWVRKAIEQNTPVSKIEMRWNPALNRYKKMRKKYLLYS
jgi:uncharacterized protein YbbC (DUF1343 family)